MATTQCQKPADQTKHHVQASGHGHNSNETRHRENNEHSFTNKVKEMANSACMMFTGHTHHEPHKNHRQRRKPANQVQQPEGHGSCTMPSNTTTEKKKKEGHAANCIPKMGDHKRKEKHRKAKKEGKRSNSSSNSSSESDDNAHKNRAKRKSSCNRSATWKWKE
ncbi:hypothetical protein RJ640_019031 [Escallonia rubra]|uniref:Uncharacterized protein n=1 Tax=Escallonia rubra TaxID=112253 RepID=A0AA88QCH9_9ASTE|nr:hypothetical protein RJ640_019031 [Escallonia rubra]